MLVLPRKKLFSCVWIPLPKKKIPVCSLCQKILSACFLCQIFLRVLSSQNCFSSYLYGSPLLEYFFSFLEMCVDMSTHQILSTLTFLSKKIKESPAHYACCAQSDHFLPIFVHISCPCGACSRCSHAFQKIEWCVEEIPSGWCGLWKSKSGCLVSPSIVADFLKNHGWCGLIMVPYLLYRLPPLDACCWRSFIAGCAWNLPLWAVRGIFHYSVLDGPSSYG